MAVGFVVQRIDVLPESQQVHCRVPALNGHGKPQIAERRALPTAPVLFVGAMDVVDLAVLVHQDRHATVVVLAQARRCQCVAELWPAEGILSSQQVPEHITESITTRPLCQVLRTHSSMEFIAEDSERVRCNCTPRFL